MVASLAPESCLRFELELEAEAVPLGLLVREVTFGATRRLLTGGGIVSLATASSSVCFAATARKEAQSEATMQGCHDAGPHTNKGGAGCTRRRLRVLCGSSAGVVGLTAGASIGSERLRPVPVVAAEVVAPLSAPSVAALFRAEVLRTLFRSGGRVSYGKEEREEVQTQKRREQRDQVN